MDQLIFIKFALITLFFASCNSKVQSDGSDKSEQSNQKDSLIVACKDKIESHYENYQKKNIGKINPDLQLEGKVSYEDENFLIISFSEILEYGSWHYSNSSIVFKKIEGQKFERIIPDQADSTTGPNLDQGLAYRNRINGVPYLVSDLTGDSLKDVIFKSSTSVRSSNYTQYSLYTFDGQSLLKSKLTSSAELEDGCGIEDTVIINENFAPSLITVKSVKIKCDSETGVKMSITASEKIVYQWRENEFMEGQQLKAKLMTEINSINDSINTLIKLGVVSADVRGLLYQELSQVDESTRAVIKEKIAFNNKFGSIYDSLIDLRALEIEQLNQLDDVISPSNFNTVKENSVQILE